MTFFFELVDDSYDESKADEGAWRQDEDQDVGGLRQEAESENAAAAEQLTDAAQDGEGQGEAQSHAGAVEDGGPHRILRGESLGATQHDAVHHNQGDEQTEGLIDVRDISLHHQLNDGHERGDDHDEARDTHLVRDEVLEQ